jgi:acetoin utilization protein AcuB
MLMPSVERYMTREPYSVGATDSLAFARRLMRDHLIRHLPVLGADAKLIGVLAERDVAVVSAVPGIHLDNIEVSRVMAPAVDVWGEMPLDEVSKLMRERKTDCVVVQGGQGVAGIFTAMDALDALADLLRRATA